MAFWEGDEQSIRLVSSFGTATEMGQADFRSILKQRTERGVYLILAIIVSKEVPEFSSMSSVTGEISV